MLDLTMTTDNRDQLVRAFADERWVVACLCAAWCGTCTEYQAVFKQLAARHPDQCFVWIDIEDQADVVGDLDVENFPTLLIQHRDAVAFFGTVTPDLQQADRLLQAQLAQSDAELAALAHGSAERRQWQRDCNLRTLLRATGN
jgi:thioredoxin 1